MSAFLSRRLRRWLLIAVALPVARLLVHKLAVTAHRRNRHATLTQVLDTADSAMSTASRRVGRH